MKIERKRLSEKIYWIFVLYRIQSSGVGQNYTLVPIMDLIKPRSIPNIQAREGADANLCISNIQSGSTVPITGCNGGQ